VTPITLIIIIGICVVITRQFQARELRTGPLVAIPLLLIGLGLQMFSANPPTTVMGLVLFGASVVLSIGFGVLRGRSERIWHTTNAAPWRQATTQTALLWAASLAARILTAQIAPAVGDHTSATAQLELLLGLSFAAQHTVLAYRAGLLRDLLTPAPSSN
jgi:hypothetical protein